MVWTLSLGPSFERGAPLLRKAVVGVQTAVTNGTLTVSRVVPSSPAERMGLKAGDRIVSIDGKTVNAPAEFVAIVGAKRARDRVSIVFARDGRTSTASGALDAKPFATEPDLDVVYDQVVANGKRIRVIVTKPKTGGPFPTLFMIGGIGAYSMDGAYAAIPYGNVLGPIARSGFALARIDKPGQGDSEGPAYPKLKFADEQAAYVQALRLVKSLPFVDPSRIAIWGHSMGGVFGPIVAAQEPVRGLAVMGTLFKPFSEYMLENSRRQSELGGADPIRLDDDQRRLFAASQSLFGDGDDAPTMARKHPELKPFADSLGKDQTFSGVGIGFFRELNQTNIPAAWAKVSAQTLVMCAENDFLSGRDDHERIAAYRNKLSPGSAEFKLMIGIDHYFIKTTSMRDSQTKMGRGEFNPLVIETLLGWLRKTLG